MSVVRIADRYVLLGVLGRGGTATVHLAIDERTGEKVALKVVHPHLASTSSVRARLKREVSASRRLQHPNLLVADELVDADGTLALRLRFHPGVTLAEQVATSGPLSASALKRLAEQLASGLSAAHRAGVVHRDLTPSNVLMEGQNACLSDFGLARIKGDETVTKTSAMGTPGYAAPEVIRGGRASPASDVYGLGATLFFAATGHPPFAGGDAMAILSRQLDDQREPVATLRPDLPSMLTTAIDALLSPDAGDRPPGAQGVLLALRVPVAPRPPQMTLGPVGLPDGAFAVQIRRQTGALRRKSKFEESVAAAGNALRETVLEGWLGVPPSASNEERLVGVVATCAGLPARALEVPLVLERPRYRLVTGVDEVTASTLAESARQLGYISLVVSTKPLTAGQRVWWVGGWTVVAALFMFGLMGFTANILPMILLSWVPGLILIVALLSTNTSREVSALPLAFGKDVRLWLKPEFSHHAEASDRVVSRTQPTLGGRAVARLDGLQQAITEAGSDLPDVVQQQLRDTLRDLRERTLDLVTDSRRLETLSHAVSDGATPAEVEQLQARIRRLDTLVMAGETQHNAALPGLRHSLRVRMEAMVGRDAVEDQQTQVSAHLLDIIATVDAVRHELFAATRSPDSGRLVMEKLRSQAAAANRAHRELDEL
jgi:uncharacterized membrane protein